jgi:hypothetical protein
MKILEKIKNKNFTFLKLSKRNFKLMTPEECLINMKNSLGKTGMSQCQMNPLEEASKIIFI